MTCQEMERRIPAYLDGYLPAKLRGQTAAHLAGCVPCARRYDQLRQIRAGLNSLPRLEAPPSLAVSLRVAASRELARRAARASLGAFVRAWADGVGVRLRNLMRPVAIPMAGGLVSAIVLFSMLVPFVGTAPLGHQEDVPTMLTTEATVRSTLSFVESDYDIVVDVLVDEQGRMIDYSIPKDQGWSEDPRVRLSVENTLLCTRFNPATLFGQPASGRMRITLRRSQVDVRG